MKSKNISSTVLLLLIVILGSSFAKAQTHVKAAANCTLYDAYLKETSETKNAVSCVDCYCKVCGDKKAKEKEAARKAVETAAEQKTSTPQKKTTNTNTTNTKSNEVILVAPKPKAEKSTFIMLSADDQKIVDAAKKLAAYDHLTFRSVGPQIKRKDYDNTVELTTMHTDSYATTRLRESFVIKSSLPYIKAHGMVTFKNKDSFLETGVYDVSLETYSDHWNDLADIQGNCVFNDIDIKEITYNKESKTYIIVKRKKDNSTKKWSPDTKEEYNPITKKITPLQ